MARQESLANLEQKLRRLNAQRYAVIAAIRAKVEQLALPGTDVRGGRPIKGLANVQGGSIAGEVPLPRRRHVSAETRERLSQLAKARWAKAKKAGKSRL
jgi:hypothetical protein